MILYLNCNDNPYSLNKKNYLLRAAQRLHWDWVKDYTGGDVDYILNIEPYTFVKGKKWTGVWEIDLLLDRAEMTEENWTQADVIYTAISNVPDRLKNFKTQLLFQASDPAHEKLDVTPQYDIVFAGTLGTKDNKPHAERRRIYEVLKDQFNVGVLDQKPFPQYVESYNQAKVQFIRSMSTPLGDGELAQRFFECLAIGPVLTNWIDDLRLTGLVDGIDYLAYRNDDEMIEKLSLLVKDGNHANFIAKNGRAKALRYHTYEHRLMTIWNQIPKNI